MADHYGNIIKTANTSYAKFSYSNELNSEKIYLEKAERVSNKGFFDFSELTITIDPGSFLSMHIHTDAIPEEWIVKARNK